MQDAWEDLDVRMYGTIDVIGMGTEGARGVPNFLMSMLFFMFDSLKAFSKLLHLAKVAFTFMRNRVDSIAKLNTTKSALTQLLLFIIDSNPWTQLSQDPTKNRAHR